MLRALRPRRRCRQWERRDGPSPNCREISSGCSCAVFFAFLSRFLRGFEVAKRTGVGLYSHTRCRGNVDRNRGSGQREDLKEVNQITEAVAEVNLLYGC